MPYPGFKPGTSTQQPASLNTAPFGRLFSLDIKVKNNAIPVIANTSIKNAYILFSVKLNMFTNNTLVYLTIKLRIKAIDHK